MMTCINDSRNLREFSSYTIRCRVPARIFIECIKHVHTLENINRVHCSEHPSISPFPSATVLVIAVPVLLHSPRTYFTPTSHQANLGGAGRKKAHTFGFSLLFFPYSTLFSTSLAPSYRYILFSPTRAQSLSSSYPPIHRLLLFLASHPFITPSPPCFPLYFCYIPGVLKQAVRKPG